MLRRPPFRHIVLSIDYEIFGNGSGDVRRHIARSK